MKKIILGKSTEQREKEEEEEVTKLSTHALQLLYECGDASFLDSNQSFQYPLNKHSPLFEFSSLAMAIVSHTATASGDYSYRT